MSLVTFRDLSIDAADPVALATFWGAALGLELHRQDDHARLTGPAITERLYEIGVDTGNAPEHPLRIATWWADVLGAATNSLHRFDDRCAIPDKSLICDTGLQGLDARGGDEGGTRVTSSTGGGHPRRISESPRDRAACERDEAARARDEVSRQREQLADARDRAADLRDTRADARDAAAHRRDCEADERDREADRRDRRAEDRETSARTPIDDDVLAWLRDARLEAAAHRRVSADERRLSGGDRGDSSVDRSSARSDRSAAARDREAGRFERGNAEADREAAAVDRDVSATDREAAHLDELTGAYRRGSGFLELEREMMRAARERQPLAVAFVDVDHLKHVNDSQGHAAGDQLLRHVANALIAKLRAYDMVIRYGGDEFVAVMNGLTAEAATARLASINSVLRTMSSGASMSIGVSELRPGDSPAELVRRADEALYRARSARD